MKLEESYDIKVLKNDSIKVLPYLSKKAKKSPTTETTVILNGDDLGDLHEWTEPVNSTVPPEAFNHLIKRYSCPKHLLQDLKNKKLDKMEYINKDTKESIIFPSSKVINTLEELIKIKSNQAIRDLEKATLTNSIISNLKKDKDLQAIPKIYTKLIDKVRSLLYPTFRLYDTNTIFKESERYEIQEVTDKASNKTKISDPYLLPIKVIKKLLPIDKDTQMLKTRKTGFLEAAYYYFHRLAIREPTLFQACFQEAMNIFSQGKGAIKDSCEIISPIAVHHKEDPIRLLEQFLKQNIAPEKHEILLFFNGDDSTESFQAIAEKKAQVEDFQAKHPELNIKISNGIIPEWRYGLKTIPVIIALMLAYISAQEESNFPDIDYKTILKQKQAPNFKDPYYTDIADKTINIQDDDMVAAHPGLLQAKNKLIREQGHILAGGQEMNFHPKLMWTKNINLYLITHILKIMNSSFIFTDEDYAGLFLKAPKQYNRALLTGFNSACSAIALCAIGGYQTDKNRGEDTDLLINRMKEYSSMLFPETKNIVGNTKDYKFYMDYDAPWRTILQNAGAEDLFITHSGKMQGQLIPLRDEALNSRNIIDPMRIGEEIHTLIQRRSKSLKKTLKGLICKSKHSIPEEQIDAIVEQKRILAWQQLKNKLGIHQTQKQHSHYKCHSPWDIEINKTKVIEHYRSQLLALKEEGCV